MIPRVDFGNLYKFVASAGLFLIFASVAAPWVFLQSFSVLSFSNSQISELSPVAEDAVRQRQEYIAFAQDWLWVLAAILFSGGFALLVIGLLSWWKRQGAFDADEDLAFEQRRQEFAPLSKDEIDEKYDEDAASANVAPSVASIPSTDQPVAGASNPDHSRGSQQTAQPRSAYLLNARQTDESLAQKLREGFDREFEVRSQVKTLANGVSSAIDLVLDPRTGGRFAQLAIEVKLSRGTIPIYARLPEIMVRLAIASSEFAEGQVYPGQPGRPARARASGVVIVVIDDVDADPRSANFVRRDRSVEYVQAVNRVLRRGIGVIRIRMSDLDRTTPDSLRNAIARAWADPNDVQELQGMPADRPYSGQ